jgi:hypothetical protein
VSLDSRGHINLHFLAPDIRLLYFTDELNCFACFCGNTFTGGGFEGGLAGAYDEKFVDDSDDGFLVTRSDDEVANSEIART